MKMRMKRIMGLFLALAVSIGCLSLNPIASYADDTNEKTFNINAGNVNITQSGTYTIEGTGQLTQNTISVTGNDITATITLNNVNIDIPNSDIQPAFRAKGYGQSNIHLTIKLKGTNSLKSSLTAGLYWTNSDDNSTDNSTLEIKGDGSLTATSRQYGAGIGGGNQCSGDNITITGGTVTATGGEAVGQGGGAAGIGGGSLGSGKNITITGGTVTAVGRDGAAGIGGGGWNGSRKNIKITGGSVKASSISATPTDGSGHSVYLVKLENQDGVNEVTVDGGTGNAKTFKRASSHPDSDTAFYLYLTGQDHVLVTSKGIYNAEWNNTTNAFTIIKFIKMEVKEQPKKLTYTEGDKLDLLGLVVTLTDIDNNPKDVPFAQFTNNNITTDPKDGTELKLENDGKPVTLKRGNLTATTGALQVKVRVFDSTHVKSMSVTHQPSKLTYTEDDKLNLDGLVVTLKDDHNLTKDVTPAEFGTYGINADPANQTPLTVANNNGKPVKLTKDGVQAVETDKLKVKARVFDPSSSAGMNDDAPATLDNGELNIQIDSAESDFKPGNAGDGFGNANAGNANAGSAPEVKQSDAAVKQSADTLAFAQAQVDAATRRIADARKPQSEAPAPKPKTVTPAPKTQSEKPAPKPQREKRIGMIHKKGESASFAGLIALYAGLIAVLGFSIAGLAILLRRK